MNYVIGTRGSMLALVQAEYVCHTLQKNYPEHTFEIKVIKTKGDVICDRPLNQIGDKGLFVTEIEEMILSGKIQIGVHSMKDMPAYRTEGLTFTKAWKREDSRDALVLREKQSLEELPYGAVIATGSIRREVQLRKLRPDLKIIDIRGNVDTRLRKMEEQKLDGIVLAAAGLHRLGLTDRITQYFDATKMVSAPAQGILALEIREDALELRKMLDALSDEETNEIAKAERGFLRGIGGDCRLPIGAVCTRKQNGHYELRAMFGDSEGKRIGYADVEGDNTEELARSAVRSIRSQLAGNVSLVGGGPGDPELITVKGRRAIRQADCIIYDRLVSPILLEEAKENCELIYVGKANHHHTMKQEEINELLINKAMQYKKVVRLKGGDVYVFGRGGEEAIALYDNGISFEVIPGITSSIAGLTYAGIPITFRGIASGFHVVTAHSKMDEMAEIDFAAMARGNETCVFLMGLSKLDEIIERLKDAGMSERMPIAVISQATTPFQRVCVSNLQHIIEEVHKEELSSPALIVVGNVVRLREKLNVVHEHKQRFLIPKIGQETTKLSKLLREYGIFVDELQVGCIRYVKNDWTIHELSKVNWMIFTSKNGVNAFMQSLKESGLDVRSLYQCKIAAIGEKTKECLLKYGIRADLVPEEYHSDALQEILCKHIKASDHVWYLKAKNTNASFREILSTYCKLYDMIVYENVPARFEKLMQRGLSSYDGILFTCASSVSRLFETLEQEPLEQVKLHTKVYSIGPKTTECLKEYGFDSVIEAPIAAYESLAEVVKNTNTRK